MKKNSIWFCFVIIILIGLICFICIKEPVDNNNESSEPTVLETQILNTQEQSSIEEFTEVVTTTVETTVAIANENVYYIEKEEKPLVKSLNYENTTTQKPKNYSTSDLYLLAQVVYAEAGECGETEMARVGQVVLNRINTDYWEFEDDDTIMEVISRYKQYPQTLSKIRNGLKPSESALKVAEGLFNGTLDSGLAENVLWQTGFKPFWDVEVVYESQWHYYAVPA